LGPAGQGAADFRWRVLGVAAVAHQELAVYPSALREHRKSAKCPVSMRSSRPARGCGQSCSVGMIYSSPMAVWRGRVIM
jgi:hypothetical protein